MANLSTALILTALLSALTAFSAHMLGARQVLTIALIICGVSSITAGLLASAVRRGR